MIINEWCPHCDTENEVEISLEELIENDGCFLCSHCNTRLMACSVCTSESCYSKAGCWSMNNQDN